MADRAPDPSHSSQWAHLRRATPPKVLGASPKVRRMRTAISLLLDCCCGCCCVDDWRAGPSSQRYCKLFGATILMASVNASELPLVNAFRSA